MGQMGRGILAATVAVALVATLAQGPAEASEPAPRPIAPAAAANKIPDSAYQAPAAPPTLPPVPEPIPPPAGSPLADTLAEAKTQIADELGHVAASLRHEAVMPDQVPNTLDALPEQRVAPASEQTPMPSPSTVSEEPAATRGAMRPAGVADVPPGCEPVGDLPAADVAPQTLLTPVTATTAGTLKVRVTNLGPTSWSGGWQLSYHLFDDAGNPASGSPAATTVAGALGVNQSVEFTATINPLAPGTWRLVWDIHANGRWLTELGACFDAFRLTVSNQPPSVTYVSPANYGTVTTLTPFLTVTGADPDLWPQTLTYQFTVCTDPAMTTGCSVSPWLGQPSWQAPGVEWARTYYWGVVVSDGAAQTSALDRIQRFTVVLPAPDDWRTVGTGLGLAKVDGLVLPYGVFVHTDRDAQVVDPNHPLYLERTFSSGAVGTEGAFGQGWISIFDASLQVSSSGGEMTATYPDGRQELFGSTSSGWVSRADLGLTTRITRLADHGTRIRETSGETVTYDSSGRLTSVTFTSGGRWDLTRGPQGTVTAITEQPSGRSIGIEWADTSTTCSGGVRPDRPYVAAVSMQRGGGQPPAQWTYAYSCLRLTAVTDADGRVWHYSTTATSFSMTSPEGRQAPGLASVGTWQTLDDHLEQRVVLTEPGSVPRTVRLLKPRSGWQAYYHDVYNDYLGVTALYCDYREVAGGAETCGGVLRTLQFDTVGRMRVSALRVFGQGPGTGAFRSWQYSGTDGRLMSMIDENENIVSFAYDAWGNLAATYTFRDPWTQVTSSGFYFPDEADPDGPTRLIGVHVSPDSTGVPLEQYTDMFRYDAAGRLIARDGPTVPGVPAGEETAFTYTTGTELAVSADGQPIPGRTVPAGLLRTTTTAVGITTYSYDEHGNLTVELDPGSVSTRRSYDERGFMLSETVNNTSRADYDRDALGLVTRETYTCTENMVTETSSRRVVERTYDRDGLPTTVTERAVDCVGGADIAPARVTRTGYDTQGRLSKVTDAAGGVTRYTYTAGNPDLLASVTDPRGRVTRYAYSSTTGRLTLVTADVGAAGATQVATLASYQYDRAGRLIYRADALYRSTEYDYTRDDYPSAAYVHGVPDPSGTGTHTATLWDRTFDGAGHVLTETVGSTRVTRYAYDAEGRPISVTLDPDGLNRRASIERDAAGRTVGTTLADDTRTEWTTLALNAAGFVTEQKVWLSDTEALTTGYSRNLFGIATQTVDPRVAAGVAPALPYTALARSDALGRVVQTEGPIVLSDAPQDASPNPSAMDFRGLVQTATRETITLGYDAFGELTHVRDGLGRVTEYTYDDAGRLTEVRLPPYRPDEGDEYLHAIVTYSYDVAGDLTRSTDPLGNATDYSYDVAGNLIAVSGPEVAGERPTVHYAYDSADQLISVTSATGAVTSYAYDVLGRRVAVRTSVRNESSTVDYVTSYTYDDAGNVLSVTTPAGRTTRYEHNAAGEPTSVWFPGRTAPDRYEYDVAGRVTKYTDGASRSIAHAYDLAGRETSTTWTGPDGAARTISYAYDAAGNRTSVTDARGTTATYAVDAASRVTRITQPASASLNITVGLGYDTVGNLVRTRDGRGVDTWTTYNAWNLPERVVEPATDRHADLGERSWLTHYDAVGNPVTQVKPGMVVVTSEYDALGRVLTQHGRASVRSGVRPADRSFGYDLDGRLVQAGTGTGTAQTYAWDDRGLLTASSGADGTETFGYDADGLLTAVSTSAGTTAYTRDGAGRVATATDARLPGVTTWTYDPTNGDPMGRSSASGSTSWSYNGFGEVAGILTRNASGTTVRDQRYEYDANGNVVSSYAPIGDDHGAVYGYDQADRLGYWQLLAADGTPQPTSRAWDTWDNADNRVSASLGVLLDQWTYDERNRIKRTSHDNDYTVINGQVTSSADGSVTSIDDGYSTRSLTWDAFGQLVADGPVAYDYDALGRLATRNGEHLAYAGLAGDPYVAPTAHVGQDEQAIRDPSGTLLGTVGTYGTRLALTNVHGDQTGGLLVTGDGTVGQQAGSVLRDPFGVRLAGQGHPAGVGEHQSSVFGFQGDYTDPATGAVDMGARWYAPTLATFLSRDDTALPVTGPASLNRYAYANANPVTNSDPTGRFSLLGAVASVLANPVKVVTAIPAWAANSTATTVAAGAAGGAAEVAGGITLGAVLGWAALVVAVAAIAYVAYRVATAPKPSTVATVRTTPGGPGAPTGPPGPPSPPASARPKVQPPKTSASPAPAPAPPSARVEGGYRVVGTQRILLVDPSRVGFTTTSGTVPTAGQVITTWATTPDQGGDCGLGGTLQSCYLPQPTPTDSCAGPAGTVQICIPAEPFPGPSGTKGPTAPVTHPGSPAPPASGAGGNTSLALPQAVTPETATAGRGAGGGTGGTPSTSVPECEPDGPAANSDPYRRPSGYRSGVRDQVWSNAIEPSTGRVRDTLTGQFMSALSPWDMGHLPGHEFWRHAADARSRGIGRSEFLDEHNDPCNYRPELPNSNRSHRGELLD